jgi:threonine dehydratase
MIEGSAGVAVAGMLDKSHAYRGQPVAIVVCGRNIALEKFVSAVS